MVTEYRDTPVDWRHGQGLPGGGPWLILANCPSRLHNTANAARGQGRGHPRCLCPRAQEALVIKRAAERLVEREKYAQKRKPVRALPRYMRNAAAPAPWLPDASCATPHGRKIMDAVLEHELGARSAVNYMCRKCPAMEACAQAVKASEVPPGSWGGYYAGMSASERERKGNTS